jgi:hypothetical protein
MTATRCPSPKVRPADQREFWRGKGRTPRPRRSPRCGTSAGRRSPCLREVDPGDNSTVFGRNRFPSCSPAWDSRRNDRDPGTIRDSLESDRFGGPPHCERPPAVGRLRSLSRSGPSATISTHCANPQGSNPRGGRDSGVRQALRVLAPRDTPRGIHRRLPAVARKAFPGREPMSFWRGTGAEQPRDGHPALWRVAHGRPVTQAWRGIVGARLPSRRSRDRARGGDPGPHRAAGYPR